MLTKHPVNLKCSYTFCESCDSRNKHAFYITQFPSCIAIQVVWLVCWLGLLPHHKRTAPESVCNRLLDCGAHMNRPKGENAAGSETNAPDEPGVKTPL